MKQRKNLDQVDLSKWLDCLIRGTESAVPSAHSFREHDDRDVNKHFIAYACFTPTGNDQTHTIAVNHRCLQTCTSSSHLNSRHRYTMRSPSVHSSTQCTHRRTPVRTQSDQSRLENIQCPSSTPVSHIDPTPKHFGIKDYHVTQHTLPPPRKPFLTTLASSALERGL